MPKVPKATAIARRLPIVLACVLAIGALWLLPAAFAAPTLSSASSASAAVSPSTSPATGYTVKAACSAPLPGHAACLALRLVRSSGPTPPATSTASTAPTATPAPGAAASPAVSPAVLPKGITPAELHMAYQLPTTAAEPQTIVLVDAYNDPNAEEDLGVYDQKYELPACTHANGCFSKVNQQGLSAPLPPANGEWSMEIATDVEVAHSLCQNCHIVLVEADSDTFLNLQAAEDTAAALIAAASKPGALEGEISDSWGGEEPAKGLPDSSAFNHPGIVIAAAAGDAGYLNWDAFSSRGEEGSGYFEGADYPASSPHVIAVGGTSLSVSPTGEWLGETVWNDRFAPNPGATGGGCSMDFAAPAWQPPAPGWQAVGCGSQRAVADVSADADPKTGVHVHDSVPLGLGTPEEKHGETAPEGGTGEVVIGGTSVASPIVASAFALAGGAHGVPYPAATLYAHAGSAALHDVLAGGNGECDGVYSGGCSGFPNSPLDCGSGDTICNAGPGYDGPTGVGTPIGLAAFQPVPGEIGGSEEGSGSGGGGNGGSGAGGSGGTANPGGGAGGLPGASSGSTSPPAGSHTPAASGSKVTVTRLSLTLGAVIALNRNRPALSTIAFTFALSAAARVRITLARRIRVHGRWHWSTLPGANAIAARAGANHARLSGRGALPSGLYRLTLTPAHGIARSIAITIG
jgi:hypothetical protein